MGNLVAAAIRNSRITLMLLLFIVLAGVSTYTQLPSREDPEILIRTAVVTAQYPGMAPERIEELIAKPIEDVIKEMPEVKKINSIVQTGVVIIKPELHDRFSDLDPIWQTLRNKMEDIKPELPQDTLGPFVNDDFGKVAAATLTLTGADFSFAELDDMARDMRDELANLPNVGNVDLYGVQEERIWMDINQDFIAQFDLSPQQIRTVLQSQNVVSAGGTFRINDQSFTIEPSGNFENLDEIRQLPIKIPGYAGQIYLQDIANVYRGYVDPIEKPVFFNGRPTIAMGVSAISGSNIDVFGDELTREVDRLRGLLPLGMELQYATYQPDLVDASVSTAVSNLMQTVVIVLLVVMAFLGMRTGLVVGALVPMAILSAVLGMAVWDIEVHRTSIAAIIVALGLLVDNGIVVAEEIKSKLQRGMPRMQAVTSSSSDLGVPLFTSSLTTILAFVPLMLAENTAGEFLRPLAQVIILALLSSWLLAIVVIPALCFWLLPEEATVDHEADSTTLYDSKFYQRYRSFLQQVLQQRVLFIGGMIGLLVIAGYSFRFVPQQFMSASDRPQFLVYLDLPAGTNITETSKLTAQLSDWLSNSGDNPEVISNIAYVSEGGPRFMLSLSPPDSAPYRSYLVVNTQTNKDVLPMLEKTEHYIRENLPSVRGRAEQLYMGPSSIGTVEYRVSGDDLETLRQISRQVQAAFTAVEGTGHIRDDWDNPVIKLRVEVDQELARRAGVTSDDVATVLSGMIDGSKVTDYREGDQTIPIMIRSEKEGEDRFDKLATINIYSSENAVPVPVLQVADIQPKIELSQLRRYNQKRTVTIYAKHQYLQAQDLYQAALPALAAIDMPDTYSVSLAGELESSGEANSALFEYMPQCLGIIILLLVWQFNSIRRVVVIITTIPLILIGAVIGLLVTQTNFSFTGMLGLFSLAGIIINNGIVLIDKIDSERAAGNPIQEAILRASQSRLRPIVMTTLTTILGLMPLVFFGGEFWLAMGVVIVFGLAVGSLLTLLFVPALYSLLMDRRQAAKTSLQGA